MDFARQLPELGLDEGKAEIDPALSSCINYLEHLRQKEAGVARMSDSSTNSSDDEYNEEAIPEAQSKENAPETQTDRREVT